MGVKERNVPRAKFSARKSPKLFEGGVERRRKSSPCRQLGSFGKPRN